jgi:hypothetical protein
MAAIALVALFVCAAALLATVEFVYRHLIAAPIAWLLTRLGGLSAALRGYQRHGAANGIYPALPDCWSAWKTRVFVGSPPPMSARPSGLHRR